MTTKRYLVLRIERNFTSCHKMEEEEIVTNVEIVGIYKTEDSAYNVATKLGLCRDWKIQEIDWEE